MSKRLTIRSRALGLYTSVADPVPDLDRKLQKLTYFYPCLC
jgi:hypothetical protein